MPQGQCAGQRVFGGNSHYCVIKGQKSSIMPVIPRDLLVVGAYLYGRFAAVMMYKGCPLFVAVFFLRVFAGFHGFHKRF
jgi:hypothetical protein